MATKESPEVVLPDQQLRYVIEHISNVAVVGVPQKNLALAANAINQVEKALRKLKQDIVRQMMVQATQESFKV